MYNNIGGKICGLARFFAVIGIIASVIAGVVLMVNARYGGAIMSLIGLLVMALGSLVAWMASWCLYGFGELISKTDDINDGLSSGRVGLYETVRKNSERVENLNALRSQGLITEEEYQNIISKR